MSGIVEFIEARLDEDEEAARDAAGWDQSGSVRDPGVWCREGVNSVIDSSRRLVIYGDGPAPEDSQVQHIVRQNPARVLREVAAKRKMLGMLAPSWPHDDDRYTLGWQDAVWIALKTLASAYSDHPDYQEDWPIP